MPRVEPHRYDRAAYERVRRRKGAIDRLALTLEYDGKLSARGLPMALGEFILDRWRSDDSASSAEKVERLLEAIRLTPEVGERELNDYLKTLENEWNGLTYQERRVLYLTSLGFQIKELARLDGVSIDAIKERLRAARRRLGAQNTTHAVAIAIRKGLLW